MKIGLLKEKICFYKEQTEVDEIGNHIETWEEYYMCHATITSETGTERFENDTYAEKNTYIFTIRYCKKLSDLESTKYRIKFRNNFYNITFINHSSYRKDMIKITCVRERE